MGLLVFGTMLFFTHVSVAFHPENSSGIKVKVLPIIYGMPSPKDSEAARRGEIVLGGCLPSIYNPRWQVLVKIPHRLQLGNEDEILDKSYVRESLRSRSPQPPLKRGAEGNLI
ncbi:MAG: hypothetical protein CLLPBCKN_005104 [Chroococcidiopsis cubana SAG 39.79]|uniref:Uncharacterized protein n=1 Tax=Chroococcidiopsis cubana SAG 39.79 TaxID=388085 RepID=A0AB37USF9_9CYAN|nr:hypothetical protein [Chroococcidiopsis cubana SAG 39.79]PSB62627.1 hypothetical protein C7B79_17270 [Chroococcidiopsis cubana CCALA 043]RUT14344.1 hypothetical protein DSM107010_03750 [Chroococcidiopsis cubana SAG 39.79]